PPCKHTFHRFFWNYVLTVLVLLKHLLLAHGEQVNGDHIPVGERPVDMSPVITVPQVGGINEDVQTFLEAVPDDPVNDLKGDLVAALVAPIVCQSLPELIRTHNGCCGDNPCRHHE